MIIVWIIDALAVITIVMEIVTGFAYLGTGQHAVISREKSPGPYWFLITLHVTLTILLPIVAAHFS